MDTEPLPAPTREADQAAVLALLAARHPGPMTLGELSDHLDGPRPAARVAGALVVLRGRELVARVHRLGPWAATAAGVELDAANPITEPGEGAA